MKNCHHSACGFDTFCGGISSRTKWSTGLLLEHPSVCSPHFFPQLSILLNALAVVKYTTTTNWVSNIWFPFGKCCGYSSCHALTGMKRPNDCRENKLRKGATEQWFIHWHLWRQDLSHPPAGRGRSRGKKHNLRVSAGETCLTRRFPRLALPFVFELVTLPSVDTLWSLGGAGASCAIAVRKKQERIKEMRTTQQQRRRHQLRHYTRFRRRNVRT